MIHAAENATADEAALEQVLPRKKRQLRFSLLALLTFITLACIALGWLARPNRVVATALFEVSSIEPSILKDQRSQQIDLHEFERFKATQVAKITSFYVLNAAVRDPAIATTRVFSNNPDPVGWLQDHIKVKFPGDGEIMSIELRGTEAHTNDLTAIVDAVVNAYQNEVVYADRQRQLSARDLKARSLDKLKDELADAIERVDFLTKSKSSTDGVAADVKLKQIEADVLAEHVRSLSLNLERDDVEANAPSRIKLIQNAQIIRGR